MEHRDPEWTFREIIQQGDKASNPQSSREFDRAGHPHAEAGDPPANALDAISEEAKESGTPVEVVLSIWDDEFSIPKEEASKYFGPELRKHIRHIRDSNDETFLDMLKTFEEDMSFLTIEDFNTVGLEGDIGTFRTPYHGISEAKLKELNANRFLWFFRAQNATTDDQERRGSWGEGKFTLENASRLGAQITWSRRLKSKPKNVLMGQTTLRRHAIHHPSEGYGKTENNGDVVPADFDSFGYFSTTKFGDDPADYAPLPVNDSTSEGAEFIAEFREKFSLVRGDEPGTSIIIPHPKEGVTNPDSLARAIIARWLITIYSGDMIVRIRKNGDEIWEITKDTVRDVITKLNWSVEPPKVGTQNGQNPSNRTVEQWTFLLDMLDESASIPDERKFVTDPAMSNAAPNWVNPFWSVDDTEQEMKRLRESFDSGGMIRIDARVNVRSRKDGVEPEEGRLLILMRKSEEETATTLFARHGMTIPFMDSAKGAVALVIAKDDDPLSKILRHAEGPAHLEWNRGAERISVKAGMWHHGQTTVDFVRNSVKSLLEIMKPDDEVETHELSLFRITLPSSSGTIEREITGVEEPEFPEGTTDLCQIPSKNSSGRVRVRSKTDLDLSKKSISINLAYQTSKGSAWNKYRISDFDDSDISVSSTGATMVGAPVAKPSNNDGLVYTFKVDSSEWKIDFHGFDKIRDVAVDVTQIKGA